MQAAPARGGLFTFQESSFAECLLHDDALAGHLSGDRQADIGQHGGGDICQAAALAQLHIAAANGHKGHHIGGVAVKGVPSGFIIFSALPWSAVIKAQPPAFSTAVTT